MEMTRAEFHRLASRGRAQTQFTLLRIGLFTYDQLLEEGYIGMSQEEFRPAFSEPPGTNLAGIPISNLKLPNPDLSSGLPYYESCAKHIEETFHASKVYIVASKSLSSNTDKLDKLISAIGKDRVAGVKKGITPHTPWSEILQITKECKDAGVDCVVTLGAGSITDGCKIVVLALANDISEPDQLARYSVESKDIPEIVSEPTVPLITIPTSLSGGEYFSLAGGTEDSTQHKHGFLHSGMGSKLIIIDAELCLTTPEYHWLSTGVRSLDHCVEALCCLDATRTSDEKAERGLRLLAPNLLKCKFDPKDIEARHQCQLAVCLGMDNIRAGIPMGGSHAIGHQLGMLCRCRFLEGTLTKIGPLGVPHGVTSCIMCPAVMKYNIKHGGDNPEISKRQNKVKEILWSEEEVAKTLQNAGLKKDSSDLGNALDIIIRTLGLPRTLKDMDISPDVIPSLSERALADFWSPTNPVPLVEAEQVREILEAVV